MDGCRKVGKVEAHGATWRVWAMEPNQSGWAIVKVAADGEVEYKANYWTAWNGSRFAQSSCLKSMTENRPDLLAALLALPAFSG
jgi:hypothetical protein